MGIQEIAEKFIKEGKVPTRDGGIHEFSTDDGDILVYNVEGMLTFDMSGGRVKYDLKKGVVLEVSELKVGGKQKAAKTPDPPKKAPKKETKVTPKTSTVSFVPKEEDAEEAVTKARPVPIERPQAVKFVKEKKDPHWVEQIAYDGTKERVDRNEYNHMITCACGNIRYLKPQDVFQVKMCKPCKKDAKRRKKHGI